MGTGVLELLGGESRTGMYGVAQTRTRLLGRRTLRPQASLVPRPPSEKSRKGLATRTATRCPRGLYTRANQIAEFSYVTFNRGCANSSVYSDHHGDQLTVPEVWKVDTEALRGNRSFHFCICVLTSRLRQKLSLILLPSRRNSTVLYCAALRSRGSSVEWLGAVSDMLKLDLVLYMQLFSGAQLQISPRV